MSKGLRARTAGHVTSHLKANRLETQEEPVFQSESEGWSIRAVYGINSSARSKDEAERQKGQIPPFSAFCSVLALNGLHNAYSYCGGQYILYLVH